ncbi:MAG: PD40 domain-containing protein [Bacteroidales bacterium]|nr:PD40 domain-containing protein [Bacteroidales bacterium]
MTKKSFLLPVAIALLFVGCDGMKVDTSQTYVPEEGGTTFVKITNEENDQLIIPNISYDLSSRRLRWWANPYFAVNNYGTKFAYLGSHNHRSNIFVKQFISRTGAQQRTFNGQALDLCFSPDGDTLCFTQANGAYCNLYLTSATQGSIMQQVTSGSVNDYAPAFAPDGNLIFFSRAEGDHYSIWSYNRSTGIFSNYCYGLTPFPIGDKEFLCSRQNSQNNYEIWRVNYATGAESIVLSMENRSFTTASLSPDGRWILFAANTPKKPNVPENIDIYVIRADGSRLTQLTYHQGHDLSPVWAPDGKSIYFLSQRGSDKGTYNIWEMNFNLK